MTTNDSNVIEFISEIATQLTELNFHEDTFELIGEKGINLRFTEDAQDFYNERHDEVETLLTKLVLNPVKESFRHPKQYHQAEMESNRLIAEFMELPTQVFKSGEVNYYFREFNSGSWYEKHELSYNVSWDWLVPVIHKIKESDLDFDVLEIGLPIDETYKAVVEFIKEYNKNIMNTTENNKLIAEFMGYHTYESNGYDMVRYSDCNERTLQDTHYHTSWDWLMLVADKIYKERGLDDEIVLMIRDSVAELNIESTYKVIVEFIKEYNN